MSDMYVPKTQKAFAGNVALWVVVAVVFFGLIGAGLWAFGVFTSDIRGAGGAIKQRNSTVNRVQKQEQFEQLAADYDGYLSKIVVARSALDGATGIDVSLRRTELVGLRQTCIDAAQQFNAESRKYTSRVWKSAGLPPTLDPKGC